MPTYLSVVILTKNAGKKLDTVLKSILDNKPDFEFEVIAIDSGSTDDTKHILSKHKLKTIEISPSSFSHGGTRNLGARHSKGEIVVFLTQDAIPKDDKWLYNLTRDFKDENVAGVFGRQAPEAGASPLQVFFSEYVYPGERIVKRSVNPENCSLQDIFFSNVNSAVRKSELEKNLFDETLIMSEDQKWSKEMLLKNKYIIYEPSAVVYHSHEYSIPEIISRNFDSGMSLKGLLNASPGRSVSFEMKYIKSGFLYLLKNKAYRYIVVFFFYEAARVFGFFLGFNSRFLPKALKKLISQHRNYWD